jgi:hypothetical protein
LEKGKAGLKGKQLFPHEIAKALLQGVNQSGVELEVFNAQWTAIRSSVQASLAAPPSPGKPAAALNLGKLVPLVDVSGSMAGIPMEVAIALGILVSELTAPAFAHRVITFHEQPSWCMFEPTASIAAKVKVAAAAPWGGSTNFAAAMELILGVCQAAKLSPADIPDLIVFSDMQFNQADRSWETHHERLVRRFAEAGVAVCGEPWPMPGITYWNLRGDTRGFPATATDTGVRLLSGFSPSLLKLLLSGEPMATINPMTTLRDALDDPIYDPVRLVLASSQEGSLAGYSFQPKASEEKPSKATKIARITAEGAEGGAVEPTATAEDGEDWEEVTKEVVGA